MREGRGTPARDGDPGEGRVVRVVGSLVEAVPLREAALYELVHVGDRRLLGEVIRLEGERATLQLFEESTGLALEEPVRRTGDTLDAELGPGLLGTVVDGVGRPLERVARQTGDFIAPGTPAGTLDRERRWAFRPDRRPGDRVGPGDVLGRVRETEALEHRILVPPGTGGRLASLEEGRFTVEEPVGRLEDGTELRLARRRPVRRPGPVADRLPADRPFVTGQRVLDFLFPVAEGGAVAVPGGFGTGKTVIEQTLARYADADVVVYVGCGERGNEMAELLGELPGLEDPRTHRPLMERTVLVVNTSNMPVVAREASVHFGITVAEYYRDMGYRVAVMADSVSRWAEALREIGSRLGEMPGEEGYPTHLAARLGRLYERAGRVRALGSPEREGALTFISAISPPGSDFSEPVTLASLRVAGALWSLDPSLAHRRHFPAVDWGGSYSLYVDRVEGWFSGRVDGSWPDLRRKTMTLLQRGSELSEIAGLVGAGALEDTDRLTLALARMVRELILAQNAFDPVDAFCAPRKTFLMVELLLEYGERARRSLEGGAPFDDLELPAVRQAVSRIRDAGDDSLEEEAADARRRLLGGVRPMESEASGDSGEEEVAP